MKKAQAGAVTKLYRIVDAEQFTHAFIRGYSIADAYERLKKRTKDMNWNPHFGIQNIQRVVLGKEGVCIF